MSHFTVLVPAKDQKYLAEVLQPYHEFECTGVNDQYVQDIDVTDEILEHGLDWYGLEDRTVLSESEVDRSDKHEYGYAIIDSNDNIIKAITRTNPNKKWDWWLIGGRWTGMLKLKTNLVVATSAGNGVPGVMTPSNTNLGYCDYAPTGEIDWDGMIADWYDKQKSWWADCNVYIQEAHDQYNKDLSFPKEVIQKANELWNDEGKRGEYARQVFITQHTTKIYQYAEYLAAKDKNYWFYSWDKISEILMTREQFEATLEIVPAMTYAFIDLDGNWNQRGEMGWFGVDDKDRGTPGYDQAWWGFVKSLPDEQVVFVVDCHI